VPAARALRAPALRGVETEMRNGRV